MADVKTKERAIENYLVKAVQAKGGVCGKVVCVGRRGFFDRLIVLPGGKVIFAEVKRPHGGRLSAHQKGWHQIYRELDVEVAIVRNREDIDRLLST
jgi:hypothetical protein